MLYHLFVVIYICQVSSSIYETETFFLEIIPFIDSHGTFNEKMKINGPTVTKETSSQKDHVEGGANKFAALQVRID